jgi:hypothetical protein
MPVDPTVALVQNMAQYGAAAKQMPQGPPPIGTAGQALATATARAAGVDAPQTFQDTQAGVIQNPFTRADATLATQNAGNAGVAAAYGQQAQPGQDNQALSLQQEITRRAVQSQMAQHENDALAASASKLNSQAAITKALEENNPHSKTKLQTLFTSAVSAIKAGGRIPPDQAKMLTDAGYTLPAGAPSGKPADLATASATSHIPTDAPAGADAYSGMSSIVKTNAFSDPTANEPSVINVLQFAYDKGLNAQGFADILAQQMTTRTDLTAQQAQNVVNAALAMYGPTFDGYVPPSATAPGTSATVQATQQAARVGGGGGGFFDTLSGLAGKAVNPLGISLHGIGNLLQSNTTKKKALEKQIGAGR